MLIGVPKELLAGENRVAATPKTVGQILKLGFDVLIEHDAGFNASFEDQACWMPVQKSAPRRTCGKRILFSK